MQFLFCWKEKLSRTTHFIFAMSTPDWEEEASAQKTLLTLGRNKLKRRVPSKPFHVGTTASSPSVPEDETSSEVELAPCLTGDRLNVLLLLFLYILQGIPLGLSGSIPMILSSRHVSYHDQAFFSLVFWPFSLKLFWAPIIDSIYSKRFGRRKSWLIPTQYLIGIFMLILSYSSESVLDKSPGGSMNIVFITAVFFVLNFLASVQDIAVVKNIYMNIISFCLTFLFFSRRMGGRWRC